jgi:hypothetical protein
MAKGITELLLADTVVFKALKKHTVVITRPKRRKVRSVITKQQNAKFKDAAKYAKAQMGNAASKAEYAKACTADKNTPYRVALTDYLTPPVIHYIRASGYDGTSGSVITIKATDDFRVVRVTVSIHDASGRWLENGDATCQRLKPWIWKYLTTVSNPKPEGTVIKVVAFDKPGNRVELEGEWTCGNSEVN